MSSAFEGKVAIVTGGSRGIGFAIASALVSRGASVTVSGRDPKRLADAAARLSKAVCGGGVQTLQADMRDYDQVAELVEGTVKRFGGLDILVNNAGVGNFGNVVDMSPDAWRSMIDTNLTGVFYCCHAAVPHLRRRGGWIINISSLAGKNSFPGAAGYCATKAGLNAFSEALMQEVRQDDIRVSYIMPGSVATGFGGHEASDAGADWKLTPEDVAQVVVDLVEHPRRSLPSRVELRPSKPRK